MTLRKTLLGILGSVLLLAAPAAATTCDAELFELEVGASTLTIVVGSTDAPSARYVELFHSDGSGGGLIDRLPLELDPAARKLKFAAVIGLELATGDRLGVVFRDRERNVVCADMIEIGGGAERGSDPAGYGSR